MRVGAVYLPEEYVQRSGRAYPWERLYRQFVGRLTIDDASTTWQQRRPQVDEPISVPLSEVVAVQAKQNGFQTRLYVHTTSGETHVFTTFRGGRVRQALATRGVNVKESK